MAFSDYFQLESKPAVSESDSVCGCSSNEWIFDRSWFGVVGTLWCPVRPVEFMYSAARLALRFFTEEYLGGGIEFRSPFCKRKLAYSLSISVI